ncbi:DsbA family protein [Leptospira semungkisensis]|uniref:DsbA family protein n=1 Tax=Leptospira semungkisensis TaxID=2484985 RepID=A0A4V3JAP0_9LEPT|nr:thioredoxin domain-containing protein [Leptospira semungkisensis]TGJ99248.1 DsbA family protein [Leptospira semungkisensis]
MSEENPSRFWDRIPWSKLQIALPWVFLGYVLLSIYPIVKFFLPDHYMWIGYRLYTISDVEKENPSAYRRYLQENNQQMYRLFSQLASSEILKREAASRGVPVEELTKFGSGYEPSPQEITQAYNQFKDQELKGKSLNEVRSDIVNYLKAVQEDREKQAFYQGLRDKYVTEIKGPELPPPSRIAIEPSENPTLGPNDAKVTIIEFSDFECPYCAMSQTTTNSLREQYKDKIKWVFRDFPMSFHKNAMFAHVAANCSIPQGKYWQLNSLLFQNGRKLEKQNVMALAKQVGLDMNAFNRCIADEAAIKKEIESDMVAGQKYGVNGTPAFFINGILVEGNMPIQNFTKIIDEELKKN